nr:MAG TPA: hypothetical protein [Caudoviricetes sp.]
MVTHIKPPRLLLPKTYHQTPQKSTPLNAAY